MNINDIIKDNNPSNGHRLLIIESFDGPDHVIARRILSDGTRGSYPKKGFRISTTRIHSDGKSRNGGFSLVGETSPDEGPRQHPAEATHPETKP